jgi:NAD(P)-dependent dehydrogenase (short-subunit alcohol dehydrogenase family)
MPPQAAESDAVPAKPDLDACLRVLARLGDEPILVDQLPSLGEAVARAYKRVRKERRRIAEAAARVRDRIAIESTGRCRAEPLAVSTPAPASARTDTTVTKPRRCYVCRTDYHHLHAHYHLLCPICAAENAKRRDRRATLTGRRALITGGRIKIGFQTALKLLRDGAEVIATTRFPKDAALRYASEPDFAQWKDRLKLYALDLRDLRAVCAFADHLRQLPSGLDILINNAAQTIRRPPNYYQPLVEREADPACMLPREAQHLLAAAIPPGAVGQELAPLASAAWPDDRGYDMLGRPLDPRPENSWTLPMEAVPPAELAEVMVVNAMAPFVLCSRLEPLLRRSRFPDRYVVNVSAMEGQFARRRKTPRHPHTNMAKAALNMLTRTSAERCARQGIFINSVDTGWVTEENPHPKRRRLRDRGFVPPLDEIDGVARVYDPIVRGVEGSPVFGLFLKDYKPVAW